MQKDKVNFGLASSEAGREDPLGGKANARPASSAAGREDPALRLFAALGDIDDDLLAESAAPATDRKPKARPLTGLSAWQAKHRRLTPILGLAAAAALCGFIIAGINLNSLSPNLADPSSGLPQADQTDTAESPLVGGDKQTPAASPSASSNGPATSVSEPAADPTPRKDAAGRSSSPASGQAPGSSSVPAAQQAPASQTPAAGLDPAAGEASDKDAPPSQVQTPQPALTVATMDQAAALAGFTLTTPDPQLPYDRTQISVTGSSSDPAGAMIEVAWQSSDGQTRPLTIRKAPGPDPVSGDTGLYAQTGSLTAAGVTVTLQGADGLWSVADWQRDGYAYAIEAQDNPQTSEQMQAIVEETW